MKTYLIEKFKSLKSKIELLDQKAEIQKIEDEVKSILCKNPWHVFNDGDQNELYLFDENNTLSIVYAGKVTKAEWKYVKELKSVEITTKDQIYMLQMAWFENTDLLCMRLYGTDEYCFMIEDKKWDTCGFKQLSDVTNHILAIEKQKEQLRIVAAKRAEEQRQELKRQRIEKEKARREKERIKDAKKRLLVERKKWEEEAENSEEVQLLDSKEKALIKTAYIFYWIVGVVFALIFFILDFPICRPFTIMIIFVPVLFFWSLMKLLEVFTFLIVVAGAHFMILTDYYICENLYDGRSSVVCYSDDLTLLLVFSCLILISVCLLYYYFIYSKKNEKNESERFRIKREYVKKKESEWCLQENIDF